MSDKEPSIDLLRHLIFYPNPATRDQFIAKYMSADHGQRKAMLNLYIWNAVDLNCIAEYLSY